MDTNQVNNNPALKEALSRLDQQEVISNGITLKACNCYKYTLDPPNVLFNTNCPDWLKQQVVEMIALHTGHIIKT